VIDGVVRSEVRFKSDAVPATVMHVEAIDMTSQAACYIASASDLGGRSGSCCRAKPSFLPQHM